MKKKLLICVLIPILFSCNSDTDSGTPGPTGSTIKDQNPQGTINGVPWEMIENNGKFIYNNSNQGNSIETIEIYLWGENILEGCFGGFTATKPNVRISVPAAVGVYNYSFSSGGAQPPNVWPGDTSGYFFSSTDRVEITELDTSGLGFVKGGFKFSNSISPNDKLEGTFEASFCRDARKLEYIDQPLQGLFDTTFWELKSGIAYSDTTEALFLYGFNHNVDCPGTVSIDTFPRFRFYFQNHLSEGEFFTESGLVSGFGEFTKGSGPVMVGKIEIQSIDTIANIVSGRLDMFAPIQFANHEITGNFTVPYCR